MSTGQGKILERKNGLNKFIMEGEMARQERLLEEQRQQVIPNEVALEVSINISQLWVRFKWHVHVA